MRKKASSVVSLLTVLCTVALGLLLTAAPSLPAEDLQITEASIVPLFPHKEPELKKGLPPGMTLYSFWAARGTMGLTRLGNGKVKIAFDFEGLIPYGVYTLWNVNGHGAVASPTAMDARALYTTDQAFPGSALPYSPPFDA